MGRQCRRRRGSQGFRQIDRLQHFLGSEMIDERNLEGEELIFGREKIR